MCALDKFFKILGNIYGMAGRERERYIEKRRFPAKDGINNLIHERARRPAPNSAAL